MVGGPAENFAADIGRDNSAIGGDRVVDPGLGGNVNHLERCRGRRRRRNDGGQEQTDCDEWEYSFQIFTFVRSEFCRTGKLDSVLQSQRLTLCSLGRGRRTAERYG